MKIPVLCDIVGLPIKNDNSLQKINAIINENGLDKRIIFHGYKPLGPELFDFFKKADVYVQASYHEGFPRTIWEAMSHCVPVIATKVGEIPVYLQDRKDCMMIRVKNTEDIVNAFLILKDNHELRRKIMVSGFQTAKKNGTIEEKAEEMINQMKKLL